MEERAEEAERMALRAGERADTIISRARADANVQATAGAGPGGGSKLDSGEGLV